MKNFNVPEYAYKMVPPGFLRQNKDKTIAVCFSSKYLHWEKLTKMTLFGVLFTSLIVLYTTQTKKETVYVSVVSQTGNPITQGQLEEQLNNPGNFIKTHLSKLKKAGLKGKKAAPQARSIKKQGQHEK